MKHGYCHIPLAPLRAEASDKSEMVSQVLFGEFFEVLEKSEKWSRIRTAHDAYEGWMDNKQYDHLFADQFDELRQKPLLRVADQMAKIHVQQALMYVPMGAALPYFDKGSIRLGRNCTFLFECTIPLGRTFLAGYRLFRFHAKCFCRMRKIHST
jgi:hypothetical protein